MVNWVSLVLNPFIWVTLGVLGVVGYAVLIIYRRYKPEMQVMYESPNEGIGFQYEVDELTPTKIYCKGIDYSFVRNARAIVYYIGRKAVTRWKAQKGFAYTCELDIKNSDGTTKQADHKYTLWEIFQSLYSKNVIDDLRDDVKQKLIESNVMITVDLEPNPTPSETDAETGESKPLPSISEQDIKSEGNRKMAELIGISIRERLKSSDRLRDLAFIGSGIALGFVIKELFVFL